MVFLPGLLASLIFAGNSFPLPPCLVRPDHLQFRLPSHGFKWVEGDESGKCEAAPTKKWLRQPSGSFDLFVYADGPSGSGRYWNLTIGLAKRPQTTPIRGICLSTSTVGWRTLQQWKQVPLAWLDDLDKDGKAELIIWNSFPLREEASAAEYGLMAWVYRVDSEASLVVDWDLSRRMAAELAKAYRSPLGSTTPHPGPLRTEAAVALEQFVDERCSMPPGTVNRAGECPTLSIECPGDDGEIAFTAKVAPEKADLTYQWSVSRGKIKSGQGTAKIIVEAKRDGTSIGASVEISGIPITCAHTASCFRSHL